MTAHHKISAFSVVSRAGRAALLGTVFGASLASAAMAVEITVWSGYPEMVPFYEHVAEGMKADHPDLTVHVEAIALREHEKRIALGAPLIGEHRQRLLLETRQAEHHIGAERRLPLTDRRLAGGERGLADPAAEPLGRLEAARGIGGERP